MALANKNNQSNDKYYTDEERKLMPNQQVFHDRINQIQLTDEEKKERDAHFAEYGLTPPSSQPLQQGQPTQEDVDRFINRGLPEVPPLLYVIPPQVKSSARQGLELYKNGFDNMLNTQVDTANRLILNESLNLNEVESLFNWHILHALDGITALECWEECGSPTHPANESEKLKHKLAIAYMLNGGAVASAWIKWAVDDLIQLHLRKAQITNLHKIIKSNGGKLPPQQIQNANIEHKDDRPNNSQEEKKESKEASPETKKE